MASFCRKGGVQPFKYSLDGSKIEDFYPLMRISQEVVVFSILSEVVFLEVLERFIQQVRFLFVQHGLPCFFFFKFNTCI